jgi:hypothetical protein
MKKLRMLGMAVVAIMMSLNFLACSDDEKADSYADLIVGTWEETGAFADTHIFNKNGSYTYQDEDEGSRPLTGTWKVTGDKLYISVSLLGGIERELVIRELTSTTLVWYDYEYETETTLTRVK